MLHCDTKMSSPLVPLLQRLGRGRKCRWQRIEWGERRQTQGTLRVGRGLGKGRVLVMGEGAERPLLEQMPP